MPESPDNPAGPFQLVTQYDATLRKKLIEGIRQTPVALRNVVSGLSDTQLDTKYRNWTIRQITHHVADSHLHSLVRFKWALTEDHPTIKAYEEADWVETTDCRSGDIKPTLQMLDGLHAKWVQVLESMTDSQYSRTFLHPQSGETVNLWTALNYYPWHGRHHTAQIQWLCDQHNWQES